MTSGSTPPPTALTPSGRRRRHPLVHFWTYSLLRIALFGVLFAILWLSGLGGLLAAAIALALSLPLSYVLLARPREALAEELRLRVTERHARSHSLDADLAGPSSDVDVVEENAPFARTANETAAGEENAPSGRTVNQTTTVDEVAEATDVADVAGVAGVVGLVGVQPVAEPDRTQAARAGRRSKSRDAESPTDQ